MDTIKRILGGVIGIILGFALFYASGDLIEKFLMPTISKYYTLLTFSEDDLLKMQGMEVIKKYYPEEYDKLLPAMKDSIRNDFKTSDVMLVGLQLDYLASKNLSQSSDEAVISYWGLFQNHLVRLSSLSPKCCLQLMDGSPICIRDYIKIDANEGKRNFMILSEVIRSAKESPVTSYDVQQAEIDIGLIQDHLLEKHRDVYDKTDNLSKTEGNEKEICLVYVDLALNISNLTPGRAANIVRYLVSSQ